MDKGSLTKFVKWLIFFYDKFDLQLFFVLVFVDKGSLTKWLIIDKIFCFILFVDAKFHYENKSCYFYDVLFFSIKVCSKYF